MVTLRRRAMLAAGLGATAWAGAARGQTAFPARPVRILVGFAAGGGNDVVARILAQKMGESLGQSVIVDNKAGASGLIAADILAKAPPDGLTLMVASQTTYCVAPVLYRSVKFNAEKDCAGVALLGASPLVPVVHPSVAAKSVAELIALAKARPGVINIGSGGVGTTPHMAGELFMTMAGIKMTSVPYRGEAPALNDLLSGQLPVLFSNISVCLPHVKSGALRALGVTSPARSPAAPDLPTLAESGLPDFEVETWFGLTAPAGTPRDIIARLNGDTLKALADPEVRRKFADLGMSVGGGTPEHLDALIKSETDKWAKVIREAGIRAD
ncbi:MAG: tripartite tricarboxylate transporter substrate binding protein [Alphaproteobacteria bacterium]|nr:tripartite tricarboxylate transporter substrate binding protein [Alphaproteobacteria bacterium]